MIKSNLYNLCFSYLTVDDEWRKTKRFKNKKHQTVLIIGLQILNTVKNKRNYTVCTTGIKEWDMTDRTALQEAGGQECRCRCNSYVPKPLLSSDIHTTERLKSRHCLRTLTQILAPSFTIKRTTTPLILYLPLPAGWTTLQYHRMKCNPSE